MTNAPAELAELADIIEASHTPFTGIAAGWWVLALLSIGLLAALSYWVYRLMQQARQNKALAQAQIAIAAIDVTKADAAQQINILLKRLVRHYEPKSSLLSCPLAEWQDFLQQQQPTTLIPNLAALLYQPNPDPQQCQLFADIANHWLQQSNARQFSQRIREHANA